MNIDFNLLSLIVGIVGVVAGIIGVLVAVQAKREQWQIAKRSGSFRKADLRVAVFNSQLGEKYPDNENWFFVHPGKGEDLAVYPIPLTLYNAGDAAANNVDLRIELPKMFLEGIVSGPRPEFTVRPGFLADSWKMSLDESGELALISCAIPTVGPKSTVRITVPFVCPSTLLHRTPAVHLGNGTPLRIGVSVLLTCFVNISINSADAPPSSYYFSIGTIPGTSMKDCIQAFAKVHLRDSAIQPERSLLSRLQWFLAYVLEPQVYNFLAFEIASEASKENLNCYFMKLPGDLYRACRFLHNLSELEDIQPGTVISVVDFQLTPRSLRRAREREGNVVTMD